MNANHRPKLKRLNADYAQLTGQPFSYFLCPILFKDEDVPLSQAHVVNKAFPDSSLTQTIQRQDVDSFYGAN